MNVRRRIIDERFPLPWWAILACAAGRQKLAHILCLTARILVGSVFAFGGIHAARDRLKHKAAR
jgi:hypothetical protein